MAEIRFPEGAVPLENFPGVMLPAGAERIAPPPEAEPYSPAPGRPEDVYQWWDRTHPGEAPPQEVNDLVNRWAREEPSGFRAFNDWHVQDVGYHFALPKGFGNVELGYQRGADRTEWEATPSYRMPQDTGGPLFGPTEDTRVNIPNIGRAALGPAADEVAEAVAFLTGQAGGFTGEAALRSQQAGEAFRQAHPTIALTSELGGLSTPGGLASKLVFRGGRWVPEVARGTATAAAGGAAYGALEADENRGGAALSTALQTAPFGPFGVALGRALGTPPGVRQAPFIPRGAAATERELRDAGIAIPPRQEPSPIGPYLPLLARAEARDEAAERLRADPAAVAANEAADRFLAPPEARTEAQVRSLAEGFQRQGQAAFSVADASGITFRPDSLRTLVPQWQRQLVDEYTFDAASHPRTAEYLNRLQRLSQRGTVADQPIFIRWGDFDNVYKDIGSALNSAAIDARDATLLRALRDRLVTYMSDIPQNDLVTNVASMSSPQAMEAFNQAQEAWRNYGRSDFISDAYTRAVDVSLSSRRNANQLPTPFHVAFRDEIKSIIAPGNPLANRFTPEQIAVMRNNIVRGEHPLHNLAHFIRGALPSEGAASMAAASGVLAAATPYAGSEALLAGLPLAGLRSTQAMDTIAARQARDALMRRLGQEFYVPPPSTLPPQFFYSGLLSGALAGQSPNINPALELTITPEDIPPRQ